MRPVRLRAALTIAIIVTFALQGPPARAAVVASVFAGRVPCAPQGDVQFCQGDVTTRVESFDGVPLDVNVTLPPASMDGPFPLIVDHHGWSLGKTGTPYVDFAKEGYVVLSYTSRGFYASCGTLASRAPDATLSDPNVCAERGWTHLDDARFEGHDTQYLAGLLADDGLVVPNKIGVTGASYGGGQSMILAALRNRTMLEDGTLVPWQSPAGKDMEIAAAAPLIPWSDLASALTPNGRTIDYRVENPYGLRGGIQKQSWNATLYGIGLAAGFYAPPDTDFEADLTAWNARVGAGEPYDGDPTLQAIVDELTSHHSAYYIDDSIQPAPLFIYNAWTDDLFPVDEALRFWRKTVAKYPSADISLFFADDFGHSRAALGFNGPRVAMRVDAFFAHYLRGVGDARPPLETITQACNGAAEEGPFTASDWDVIHPGEVRYTTHKTQRFDSAGGKPDNAEATDPLLAGGTPCRTVPSDDDKGAATYRLPAAKGTGYTLLGTPTVIADLATTGENAQIAARLWDVATDGKQTLVAQSLYRPRTDNAPGQVFQIHANGWRFAAGHVPKLELLGQSAPYGRASNGVFTVTVSRLELRLPVREAPDGKTIESPAMPVMPPDAPELHGCALVARTDCHATAGAKTARIAIGVGPRAAQGRLAWRWKTSGAPASLGDPTATTTYALCLYDGGGDLIASAMAPAGATCGKKPCWSATKSGFHFADPRASMGLRSVGLDAGAGSTTLDAAGKGPRLGTPRLPVTTLPLIGQLVNTDGTCWAATFGTARKNTARLLEATSN
jgi:hypothetical protein